MATSRNPFELLQDDFEEKAAVAAVVVKETAPVKAPQNKTQKVAIQKDGAKKPIQKNLKKVQVKENNFEEEPSHKEEVQVKGSGPGTTDAKKRQFDRKSANGKQISSKKSHGKASWGEEVDGQTWTQEEIEE